MSKYRVAIVVMGLALAAGILACTIGQPAKPSAEILSPPNGSQVELGDQVEVEYRATDPVAVVRVELEADGQVVDVQNSPVAEGQAAMNGVLRWSPTTPGSHTLIVYAYNGDWEASEAVGVDITVVQPPEPTATPTSVLLEPTATPMPPTPTTEPPTPTTEPPTPTNTSTAVPPTATRMPPTPTHTPTATRTPQTPSPTPITCPSLKINVPSTAYPKRVFGIEWDSAPNVPPPPGWEFGLQLSGDKVSWTQLPVPLDPYWYEEGGHFKAVVNGPGAEGVFYWQVCLVNMADPSKAFQCCGPVPPWPIAFYR